MNGTYLFRGLALAASFSIVACGGAKVEPKFSESASAPAEHHEKAEKPADVPIPAGLIKINEVTAEQLVTYKVSGLGEKGAEKLVAYREANGPFHSMEDIDKVPGVGEAMMAKLQGRLDFGAAASSAPAGEAAGPSASTPAAGSSASTSKAPAASGAKVNINTATLEQLQDLKGVGASTAQKIIDYRASHGKFKSVDELDNVAGIGKAKIDGFRDQVTL